MSRAAYKATSEVCAAVMEHRRLVRELGTLDQAIHRACEEHRRQRSEIGSAEGVAHQLGISISLYWYIVGQGGVLKTARRQCA